MRSMPESDVRSCDKVIQLLREIGYRRGQGEATVRGHYVLDGTESVLIRKAYEYWTDKRRGRAAPSRADIDPLEMKGFLPHLALVDVEQNPRRYRTRLIGTAYVEEYGKDTTGQYIDEVDLGREKERLLAGFDAVVASCMPRYMEPMETCLADGRSISFERVVLPLSNDGTHVNMLLVCLVARDLSKP